MSKIKILYKKKKKKVVLQDPVKAQQEHISFANYYSYQHTTNERLNLALKFKMLS